jgi:hypothetical protein
MDNLTTRRGRLWRSFLNNLVQDVPDTYALCEFDCRKPQCTVAEWTSCERRIQRAPGELMPRRQTSRGTNSKIVAGDRS